MGRQSNAAKLAAKALMEDENKNADQEMENQVKVNARKKRAIMSVIRKSGRIHKKVTQSTSKMVEKNVIEEIRISESDKDDGHLNNDGKSGLPEIQKTVDGRTLEEKVEYLLQVVDQLLKKPNVSNDQYPRKNTSLKGLKSIDAQKEIESLKEENNQLCKKLDIAVGKLEAYGEGNRVLLDTLKEVILSPSQAMPTNTLLLPAAKDAKMDEVVESPTNGVAKKRGRKAQVRQID
ncbi:uncharacterized protein LOC124937579 [Impatiens glandulifera]|uniref:uncharacterized protein LOC124937579 n=1 Tax=Impatiens glandulifera TaxID=253017 RepID=UPI001FB12880|nr:uncharacterized protein LOC124937579 [Impatiens glandulifera]